MARPAFQSTPIIPLLFRSEKEADRLFHAGAPDSA